MLELQAIGNVGADATITEVKGKTVINLSVGVTEKYKQNDGTQVERTVWLKCSKWDKMYLAPMLKKGTKVFISGKPGYDTWKDKDGNAQGTITCNVFNLELLSSKKE